MMDLAAPAIYVRYVDRSPRRWNYSVACYDTQHRPVVAVDDCEIQVFRGHKHPIRMNYMAADMLARRIGLRIIPVYLPWPDDDTMGSFVVLGEWDKDD